jgi:hypothetical protein
MVRRCITAIAAGQAAPTERLLVVGVPGEDTVAAPITVRIGEQRRDSDQGSGERRS